MSVRIRGKAKTWGIPKGCKIVWDGKDWYGSSTVDCVPERQTGNNALGLDFGGKTAIATSNGGFVKAPRFQTQAQEKVNLLSKKLGRKQQPVKGKSQASRRWKKYQGKIRRVKRIEANRRCNWSHQVAAQMVSSNRLVATEKLNLKGMTRKGKRQKTGLNRSIVDVAIGKTKDGIKYKVEEANGVYLETPTRQLKPTPPCAKRWETKPKTWSDRVHHCQGCGHSEDRDINAAQVILIGARGQELSSSDVEPSSSVSCGSMKKTRGKEAQKQPAQRSG